MSMARWDLMLSQEQRDAIKKVGRQRGISAAQVVRTILDRALGIEAPKPAPLEFADEPGQDVPIRRGSRASRSAK